MFCVQATLACNRFFPRVPAGWLCCAHVVESLIQSQSSKCGASYTGHLEGRIGAKLAQGAGIKESSLSNQSSRPHSTKVEHLRCMHTSIVSGQTQVSHLWCPSNPTLRLIFSWNTLACSTWIGNMYIPPHYASISTTTTTHIAITNVRF